MSTDPLAKEVVLRNCALVIPVFNEARRLSSNFWIELRAQNIGVIILVNDGSFDDSEIMINNYLLNHTRFIWIRNVVNLGKGESIRIGMKKAVELEYTTIITIDADGAVKPSELESAISIHNKSRLNSLRQSHANGIITSAARVRLSGWEILRKNSRQWLGRIVATLVSIITKLQMYDPQTPLKIYSFPKEIWQEVLSGAFRTRWFVDVELILRFRKILEPKTVRIEEFPIAFFEDIPGSNLSFRHSHRVFFELLQLRLYR